jgi:hypothetical protein
LGKADIEDGAELMDIHKPKPIRNWREFLKEYAIIVIGVLTALGAEQAVEWAHWRHRVADAVEAIELELRDDDGTAAYTRAAAVSCFDRQLDAIQKAIEDDRPRTEITGLIRHYAPPGFVWDRNAWDALLASDVASHVAPERMINWGYVYSFVVPINERLEKQIDDMTALNPTRKNGDRLTASEADTMLAAVARLRTNNRRLGRGGGAVLGAMARAGITLTQAQRTSIIGDLRSVYSGCVIEPRIAVPAQGALLSTASSALKRRMSQP